MTTKNKYIADLQNLAFDESTNSFNVNAALVDKSGRSSANTVFGDAIVGNRVTQINAQFQYPLRSTDSINDVGNGGSIYQSNSSLVLETTSDSLSYANIQSTRTIRYVPGHEVYCLFTAVFGNSIENQYQRVGLFDDDSGFFIGYEGEVFTFTHRRDSTDNHYEIDLEGFNTLNNYILDPHKGNIYRITYGFLGYAPIRLEVLSPSGKFLQMFILEYPNSATQTHISQTFLPLTANLNNNGSTNSINIKIGSVSAGIVNGASDVYTFSRFFSFSNNATLTIPNNIELVSFRSKGTFGGIKNYIRSRLLLFSGANELNKNARWLIIRNPVFTNTPTWTDANIDSVMEYSVDGIINRALSNDLSLAVNVSKIGSFIEQVDNLMIELIPGETATIYLETDGAGEADLSMRWVEFF